MITFDTSGITNGLDKFSSRLNKTVQKSLAKVSAYKKSTMQTFDDTEIIPVNVGNSLNVQTASTDESYDFQQEVNTTYQQVVNTLSQDIKELLK